MGFTVGVSNVLCVVSLAQSKLTKNEKSKLNKHQHSIIPVVGLSSGDKMIVPVNENIICSITVWKGVTGRNPHAFNLPYEVQYPILHHKREHQNNELHSSTHPEEALVPLSVPAQEQGRVILLLWA